MQERIFHREDYPLDILAEFGLSEEMIYDLPNFVHENLEMGCKSPLLPICIEQPFGETHAYAKFSLIYTEHGLDVLFFPKLKSINLEQFSDQDKAKLQEGKVIVADIDEKSTDEEGKETTHRIKVFVQIDKDTNDVVYTPTQVIGRNLSAIAGEYNLDGDQLLKFWEGELVTVNETNEQGGDEPVTIGIDLFSDKGVVIVPGTSEVWENAVRKPMPEYSFGNDGCWVNKKGELRYVPDSEFTKDILEVLQKNAKANENTVMNEYSEERSNSEEYDHGQEESRQLTR